MFRLKNLAFGVTICIVLTSISSALPVESGSPDKSSKTPADRQQVDDPSTHHSDILSILGALKGGNELQNMESLVKSYSILRGGLKLVFKLSPLYTRLFETASKSNAAMRTIIKVVQGHVPDVVDIYDLATNSRKNHLASDLMRAEGNDEQYHQFSHYVQRISTLHSSTDIKNMVKLLTGKDVSLSQHVVDAVNAGNILITKENIGQVNLMNLVNFVLTNYQTFNSSLASLTRSQNANMLLRFLNMISATNLSPLTKIKVMKEPLDNDKYSINGGRPTFLPDPDVAPIVADYASAKKMSKERNVDDSKVVSLIADVFQHEARLFERILEGATTDNSRMNVHTAVG